MCWVSHSIIALKPRSSSWDKFKNIIQMPRSKGPKRPKRSSGPNDPDRPSFYIRILYIVAIIGWILIILALSLLHGNDVICWLILLVPIVLFGAGAINAYELTADIEDSFVFSSLSLGLLIVIPLMTFINRDYKGDRQRFIAILVLAIILSMASMVDLYVAPRWLPLTKHFKSIMQTYSIVLIIYALYSYYLEQPRSLFT